MTYIEPKETNMSTVVEQIRREYAPTIKDVRERHGEYRQRVEKKHRAEDAYRNAEAKVPELQGQRDGLFSEFQRASFEEDHEGIKEVSKRRRELDKAIAAAEKSRDRARAAFEKVAFREDTESFKVWKQAERDAEPVFGELRALGETLVGPTGEMRTPNTVGYGGVLGELGRELAEAVQAQRDEHYAVRRETSGMESVAYQESLENAA